MTVPDRTGGFLVIDASVAAKWFVDEPLSEEARSVLLALRDHPERFAVPELFFVEMLSVLARITESEEQLKDLLGILEELGLARLALGHETLRRAAELTLSWGLTAYDAVYAATADLLGGQWLTADARAHTRIASLGISSLLSQNPGT
jgi:predicted nucleic acid-binding protein